MGNHTNRIDRSNIHEWIERLYSPDAREAFAEWEKEIQTAESSDALTLRIALEDGVSRGRPYAMARAFLAEVLVNQAEHPDQSLETLSPLTAQLVQRLSQVAPGGDSERLLFADADFNSEPARKLASWSGPVPEMATLDFISRTLAMEDEFAGFSVAAVLHALESNVKGLLGTYADLGADYGRFQLIDKDYSTHAESMRWAEHRGATHVRADGIAASASGRIEMLHRADQALRDIIATLPEPHQDGVLRPQVQILDDGAFLIRRLHHNPEFRPYAEYFAAVELTRKGIRDVRRLIAEEICGRDLGGARSLIAREVSALDPDARAQWAERSRGRLETELRYLPDGAEDLTGPAAIDRLPDSALLFALQELLEVIGDGGVNRILSDAEAAGEPVLGCAVGNLAEADVKLRAESSLVGYSIAVEADAAVQHLRASGVSGGKTAVVIGAGGANGRHIAETLAEMGYQVLAVERASVPLPEHPNIRAASLEDALPEGDLVVSCAGDRTLFDEHYPLLKNHAVVCQGASDDEELGVRDAHLWATTAPTRTDRDGFVWSEVDGRYACTGHRNLTTHSTSTYRVTGSGHTVFFPNRGKVINFNGAADPIPPRYIQVTRAAMLAMSVLTRRATAARLISMPEQTDRELIGVTERALDRTGESLFRPSWAATTPALPTAPPPEIVDPPAPKSRGPTRTLEMNVGLSPAESQRLREAHHPLEKYRLGPVTPGSFEEIVLRRLGVPGGELRVEHAAADTAVGAFWGLFGAAGARVNLTFATDSHAPRYSNPGENLSLPGQPATRDGFSVLLGGFLRHLLETHGAEILRHELTPAELAENLRDGFSTAGVDPAAFVTHLSASADARDRAIARALVPTN